MRRTVGRMGLALGLAAGLLPLLAAGEEADGRRYALLIGVKNYKKDQFRPLKYTENDVNALAGVFKGAGFKRVVLMTQAAAKDDVDLLPTAANVCAQLKSLLEDRGKSDTVVVAFSGHGVQFKEDKGHYFCPMDADLTDRKTLVSLKNVYEELKKCDAQVKLLLVDACRNDPLAAASTRSLKKVKLESNTRPQKETVPGGVAALFSCSAGQESYESDLLERGVFFHHVIEGLMGGGKAGEGLLALAKHVAAEVPDWVKEEFGPMAQQRPEINTALSGEVLLVPPSKEATTAAGKGFTNLGGMKLVKVPGGKFTMGSPADEPGRGKDESSHAVEVSEFYIGAHEVTQRQYQHVMGKNPSHFAPAGEGKAKVAGRDTSHHPVEQVSWEEAAEFCRKLNERADRRRPSGWAYRLPREAEWEYACRGGATAYQTFHFGNSLSSSQANFDGTNPYGGAAKGDWPQRTAKVGSYNPNGFGLYDLHGNVYEWCADWYMEDYYASSPKRDPEGPTKGADRVVRGGSWVGIGRRCRSANRVERPPGYHSYCIGFRVALVPASRASVPK